MTEKESAELWNQLVDRIENHNKQIGGEMNIEDMVHLEVIEIPSVGILLCKTNSGRLSLMMGQFGHNVGDIISLAPNGEKAGDAVGMKIVPDETGINVFFNPNTN